MLRFYLSLRKGLLNIYFRNGHVWQVKAPWNKGLWSERQGLHNPKVSLFGWRVFVKRNHSTDPYYFDTEKEVF